ncbi:hypothetical protein Tco_1514426 [Tanacetum coccineum]
MASTRASISKTSKRPKINIIPPKQLFINLTNNDTKTLSLNYQVLSPSAPNAPSKTSFTIAISSSTIDHKPKSPTSSTSPSTHGYLNSSMSPPPRVPSPPPTQESGSMDITSPFHQLLHLMFNSILHHLPHLSLVIPFRGTFLKHIVIHAYVAFTIEPSSLA